METLLPQLAIDLAAPAPHDLAELFPFPVDSTRLEIGFGGGEHMIAQAEQHAPPPDLRKLSRAVIAMALRDAEAQAADGARAKMTPRV